MKIHFPNGFRMNINNFLRKAGYSVAYHSKTGRINYIRRITTDLYPHYHIYVEKNIEGQNYLTLHLDQKRPSYKGSLAHSGEYNGKVVESEFKRILRLIHEY